MIPGRGVDDMHSIADSWHAIVYPQQRGRNDPEIKTKKQKQKKETWNEMKHKNTHDMHRYFLNTSAH